jgi:hypothetical protein
LKRKCFAEWFFEGLFYVLIFQLQMFSAKLFKYFLAIALIFCSSCRYWQNPANSNVAANQTNVAEIESDIPFSTKEPETFQVEIITTFEEETEKTFIAQSRGRVFLRKGEIATLQTEPNKSFLINFEKKVYVENIERAFAGKENSAETLNDFLTTEWLNQKSEAKIESLGEENGLSKYRTSFENSESLIFVDENFKIPIRQEFYSIEGEAKTLLYSTELRNFKLIAEDSLFEVPKDFRKISLEEFQSSKH